MHTRLLVATILGSICSVGALGAQTSPFLLGLTHKTAQVVRLDYGSCQSRACSNPVASLTAKHAGGCAFDAAKGWVWLSMGGSLWAEDPITCQVTCPPHTPAVTGDITGLAVYEPANLLLISTSTNQLYTANTVGTNGLPLCPVVLNSQCDFTNNLPTPSHTIGGIEVDDVTGAVLVIASDFSVGGQQSVLYVTSVAAPGNGSLCRVRCATQVRDCGLTTMGPMTGIAFDSCKRQLWLTDGTHHRLASFDPAQCQSVASTQCCNLPLPNAETFVDLAILPPQSTSLGQSCNARPCDACPNMVHTTGYFTIGGLSQYNLHNAPAGSNVFLILSFTGCDPVGVPIPLFCEPIRALPIGLVAGPIFAGGVGTCDGRVHLPAKVPLIPAYCGQVIGSQFVTTCAPSGIGVSNCVNTMIYGS